MEDYGIKKSVHYYSRQLRSYHPLSKIPGYATACQHVVNPHFHKLVMTVTRVSETVELQALNLWIPVKELIV